MKIQILEQDREDFDIAVKAIGNKRFYVYLHFRATDNKLFYVGKGTGYRCKVIYKRNSYWQKVASKHGVYTRILSYNLTFEESGELEIQAIAKAGLNNLVNVSLGGINGLVGELNHMFGVKLIGKSNGNFNNKYASNPLSIPIVCLNAEGILIREYDSAAQAEDIDKFSASTIIKCCKGIRQHHKDHIFVYKHLYDANKLYTIVPGVTSKRKVNCYDLQGTLIKSYTTARETAKDGYLPGCVQQVCRGDKKTHKSKIFKYVQYKI